MTDDYEKQYEEDMKKLPDPILTLSLKGKTSVTRVYLLNPGQHFPRFGGSSRGLVVGKTASLIVRYFSGFDTKDVEYDLADPKAWRHLRKLLGNPEHVRLEETPDWDEET